MNFFLFCFCSNSLMNCVFRDEVKRNSFTRDEVDSDYFTTFTQNFSDTPANTNKNYTT